MEKDPTRAQTHAPTTESPWTLRPLFGSGEEASSRELGSYRPARADSRWLLEAGYEGSLVHLCRILTCALSPLTYKTRRRDVLPRH